MDICRLLYPWLTISEQKNTGCKTKKERKPERYVHFIYIVLNSYQGANRFCLFILLIVFTIFFFIEQGLDLPIMLQGFYLQLEDLQG